MPSLTELAHSGWGEDARILIDVTCTVSIPSMLHRECEGKSEVIQVVIGGKVNDWQFLLNVDKCKVMHMGYNNTCTEYFLNGTKLESISEEKDIGVIVSDDLKWEKQCSQTVAKANKVLGLIKRNFTDRSKEKNNSII